MTLVRLQRGLEDFALPDSLRRLVGHDTVPIGFAFVATPTGSVGAEMCEELWVPQRYGRVYVWRRRCTADGAALWHTPLDMASLTHTLSLP